jgi:adenylosuccinate synthase
MMFSPEAAEVEAEHLHALGVAEPLSKLYVARETIISTTYDLMYHRERLAKVGETCGTGTHATHLYYRQYGMDSIFAGDLLDRGTLVKKLELQRTRYGLRRDQLHSAVEFLADRLHDIGHKIRILSHGGLPQVGDDRYIVYEGSQGMLLDEHYGFPPTTWGDLTAANARELMLRQGVKRNCCVGVTRAYGTRHGVGEFPCEFKNGAPPEYHLPNEESKWQGPMRYGYLDAVTLAYAATVAGFHLGALALTCLDDVHGHPVLSYMSSANAEAMLRLWHTERHNGYENRPAELPYMMWSRLRKMPTDQLLSTLRAMLKVRSALVSNGPRFSNMTDDITESAFLPVNQMFDPSDVVDLRVLDDVAQ